jgi:hypothetical protein
VALDAIGVKRDPGHDGKLRETPTPGCFCERVRICLIAKDLTFFATTKSLQ